MTDHRLRPLERTDREWVAHFIDKRWLSTLIVTRGRAIYGHLLPGFVAERDTEAGPARIGLITYRLEEGTCEIITLDSLEEKQGVGNGLIEAVAAVARAAHCTRLSLVTTNDNLEALLFYQRRGFRLVALYPDAIEQARRLKPQIPLVGRHGIQIHDELELHKRL
jgi:GNAT superfamily N-acetyltransferase